MGTHLVVVGVGQAGHQRRPDSAAASDDQGGGTIRTCLVNSRLRVGVPAPAPNVAGHSPGCGEAVIPKVDRKRIA
jgi:hypothetical protein